MSPTVPTDAGPGPRFRASDVERMAVAQVLQDAVARGLLTPDEGSDRTGAAFAAVYRDELPALTVDLPPAPDSGSARRSGRSGRSGRVGSRWDKARAFIVGMWVALLGVVSRWSPRKRIIAAAAVGVLLLLVGIGLVGAAFDHHGLGGGAEHLHR